MSLEPANVIAPSGPFDRAVFEKGMEVLRPRYALRFDERIFQSQRYLAGGDVDRAQVVQAALDDPSAKAVFVARGGYGAMRLLARLKPPEGTAPVVGFSDVTALHGWLNRHGRRSIHGPNITQLGTQPESVVNRLFDLLVGNSGAPLQGTRTMVPGRAEGRLVGGNLAVLASLVGTPFFPETRGALLLLEDVGERPYRIDRLFTQLRLSGALDYVAGIVLGDFTGCEEKDANYGSADVLFDLVREIGKPCVAGFPIGHGDINQPVVLGSFARLDANAKQLEFLSGLSEPVV